MWRFNLRERWRARTYTPLVLVPWVWILLTLLFILFGFNACGFTEVTVNPAQGEFQISSSDALDGVDAAIFWATMAGGCVIAIRRRRTRRGRLQERGWTFWPRGARVFDGRFHLFPFGLLSRLRLTQAACGDYLGASCASFSVWPRWQVVRRFYDVDLVELPRVLPPVALFPERQYERVAAALGGDHIITESDDFNRRWRVVGRDRRYALAVLHPLMMEYLARPDFDAMPITIEGGAIMTWQPGRSSMEMLGARLTALHGAAALIPRHVWDDYGTFRNDAWGQPGVLLGPAWDAAQRDSSSTELYPTGLSPAMVEFAREHGGPNIDPPSPPRGPATIGIEELLDFDDFGNLDDLDDAEVDRTQVFDPEEDAPRP